MISDVRGRVRLAAGCGAVILAGVLWLPWLGPPGGLAQLGSADAWGALEEGALAPAAAAVLGGLLAAASRWPVLGPLTLCMALVGTITVGLHLVDGPQPVIVDLPGGGIATVRGAVPAGAAAPWVTLAGLLLVGGAALTASRLPDEYRLRLS